MLILFVASVFLLPTLLNISTVDAADYRSNSGYVRPESGYIIGGKAISPKSNDSFKVKSKTKKHTRFHRSHRDRHDRRHDQRHRHEYHGRSDGDVIIIIPQYIEPRRRSNYQPLFGGL